MYGHGGTGCQIRNCDCERVVVVKKVGALEIGMKVCAQERVYLSRRLKMASQDWSYLQEDAKRVVTGDTDRAL